MLLRMKPFLQTLGLLLGLLLAGSASAEDYFVCQTREGERLELSGSEQQLAYQIEPPQGKSLFFVAEAPNYDGFTYNHYFRYQTDYRRIRIKHNQTEYLIYADYADGEISEGMIIHDLKTDRESVYPCQNRATEKLNELMLKLQCNTESALGCAE